METAGNKEFDSETEKKGLGTPATRASIIEKLVSSGYAQRKGCLLYTSPMMVGVERPLTDLHGTDLLKVLKTEKSLPVSAKICPESAETICK